jgi:aryl-alcohol dehydrogenase-like predicted oxidoreductase
LIGTWMKERKNRVQVNLATKGGHPEFNSMHIPRLSKAEIIADLEASLKHLQVDCIDLYWMHRDDPTRPVEEILETLAGLVKAGKIRCYGCSNWRFERIQAAQVAAADQGFPGFAGVQNLWSLATVNTNSLIDPTLVVMDTSLWGYHHKTQLAAIPFSSQANGLFQKLEGGQEKQISEEQRKMLLNKDTRARFEQLQALKTQTGLTTSQVVLGYLTGQPFPTIPVIGPKNLEQLQDSLCAAEIALTEEHIRFLEG